MEIACNMPVTEGMRVLTESSRCPAPQGDAAVHPAQPPGRLRHLRQGRRVHAAGLPLRDNGRRRLDGPKVHATKYFDLSSRDRARQRALHPLHALRALHARDLEVERAGHPEPRRPPRWCARSRTGSFEADPYSDNVIDICPVGALLSKQFLHKARVWYLKPTPSVCPGCARGCTVDLWHRKPEWKLNALTAREHRHRPRDAAREPGGQRPVDLQQGSRPRAGLRAAAGRAGLAQGPAGATGRRRRWPRRAG
jgi:NADH-quinone oxidoreductase subunit G